MNTVLANDNKLKWIETKLKNIVPVVFRTWKVKFNLHSLDEVLNGDFGGRIGLKELVELAFCVFTQVENKAAVLIWRPLHLASARLPIRKHELFAQNLTLGYATAEIMKSKGNIGCLRCWLSCFCGRVNEQAVQAECNNNIQVRARLRVLASGRFSQHSNTSSAINNRAISNSGVC